MIIDAPTTDQINKKLELLREKTKLNAKQPKLASTKKFKADLQSFKKNIVHLQIMT